MAEHPRRAQHRLLVLGAGAAQLGLLEAAAARDDVFVVAADRDPLAPGFALADERAVISSEDEQAIERLARARAVHGIVSPGADWPVGVAARVAERLGLPHPIDGATAAIATSKTRQRERFALAGVRQPRTFAAGDAGVPVPCVVKAADRQGQRGLTLVSDAGALEEALRVALEASRGGGVLIEELVGGPELTVNAVSIDGRFVPLTVTDRVLADAPAFGVALAHVWPSEHATEAVAAAAAAVAALGIANGPTYTQIRLDADGHPFVMEVAARIGGGHDAELCRAVLGVDLNALAIAFALGEPVALPDERPAGTPAAGGGCVRFLRAPEGKLAATEGVEEALAVEGVEWVRLYRRPGWTFGPLRRGADRAGAVLAVGSDRDEAVARACRAAEAVRFQVDAHPA